MPPTHSSRPASPLRRDGTPRARAWGKANQGLRQPLTTTTAACRRGRRVSYQWADCERTFIAARYDRIAGLIGFIDWLFFVPPRFRNRAAQRLAMLPGD